MNKPTISMPVLAYAVAAPASIEIALRLRGWIAWLERTPIFGYALAVLIVVATLSGAWIVWAAAYTTRTTK